MVNLEIDEVRARSFAGEVPLNKLHIGDRFACLYQAPPEWGIPDRSVSGTVLWVGVGSIEVILDDKTKETESERWAPDCTVVKLQKGETAMAQAKAVPAKKAAEATQAPASSANQMTIKAYQARYKLVTAKVNAAAESGDEEALNQAIERQQALVAEAAAKGVDEAMLEGNGGNAPAPAAKTAPAPKTKAQKDEAKMNERNEALATHRAEAKAAKPAKPKKVKKLRPCLDGCGGEVTGNFLPGHDAKLKSIIHKVERGELELDAIPEVAQDLVVFKKGELSVEKDDKGKVISKTQTYICTKAPVRIPGRGEGEFTLTVRGDDE